MDDKNCDDIKDGEPKENCCQMSMKIQTVNETKNSHKGIRCKWQKESKGTFGWGKKEAGCVLGNSCALPGCKECFEKTEWKNS